MKPSTWWFLVPVWSRQGISAEVVRLKFEQSGAKWRRFQLILSKMGESGPDIRYGVGGLIWPNSKKLHSYCILCYQNFFEHKGQLYKVNDASWTCIILRAVGVDTKHLKSFLEKYLVSPSIMQFNELSAPPPFWLSHMSMSCLNRETKSQHEF